MSEGGLVSGFALIAGGLLGAALTLPLALAGFLRLGESLAKGPVAHWFWADSRQQLPGLSLALMALLLSLSTNIGVGAMVEGFRVTFTRWLDERLVAEVYFEATDNASAQKIEAWLARRTEVEAILPVWRTKTQIAHWPVEVFALRAHQTYRDHFPLLAQSEGAWDRLAQGAAALVSEQLARRLKLSIGQTLDIPTESDVWRATIVGVYPDYGNPNGQLRVDADALARHWPQAPRTSYSLRVAPPAVANLIRDFQGEMGPSITRIVDQAYVKRLSLSIFERTFAVTAALNTLTLIVSAIALLASLLTLSNLRLAQLAPVWAVGVARRRLAGLELARILLFAAATALFALPLGLFMAWCLVAIVNVEAFGWRLPFHMFPGQWAQVFAIAMLTGFLGALAPALRLARVAPADLLKVFSNER
jgi:putative ABC transport system permease protein